MRGVVRVFLTLALAASCTGYFMAEKQITVSDEGRIRKVKTFAPNVGAVLGRLGLELGPDDRVFPSPGSKLDINGHIEVRRAKKVVVVVNGSRRTEKVTGRTVSEVLEELSVARKGALIEPAPMSTVGKGEEIRVAQPVLASIVHDGITRSVVTNVLTVGELLKQAGIPLGPSDKVQPGIAAYPSSGSVVKIVRVKEVMQKEKTSIPFKRLSEKSADLEVGVRKVKTRGVEGLRVRSFRVNYEDGKVKSKVLTAIEESRAPIDEVTMVGTKRPVVPVVKTASHSAIGNASWYAQPGMIAAHPTLPFGTVVKVINLANGKSVAVTIKDRGPFSEGRIIDLSDGAFKQISTLGSGVVKVRIEW